MCVCMAGPEQVIYTITTKSLVAGSRGLTEADLKFILRSILPGYLFVNMSELIEEFVVNRRSAAVRDTYEALVCLLKNKKSLLGISLHEFREINPKLRGSYIEKVLPWLDKETRITFIRYVVRYYQYRWGVSMASFNFDYKYVAKCESTLKYN